jgi:hypothetical protein
MMVAAAAASHRAAGLAASLVIDVAGTAAYTQQVRQIKTRLLFALCFVRLTSRGVAQHGGSRKDMNEWMSACMINKPHLLCIELARQCPLGAHLPRVLVSMM